MIFNEGKNVVTCDALVLWDGITQPETKPDGTIMHSIKVGLPANSPEAAELEQLAKQTLMTSEFKGNMPAGGSWPILQVDPTKFGDTAILVANRIAINAKTRIGAPAVYDANGNQLQPMQYGRLLYAGSVIKIIVHAFAFNNIQKGIAFGLDGIQIVDATAPKLDVGGGLSASQVANAFATAKPTVASNVPPPIGIAPHPDFVVNAGLAPVPPPVVPVHRMTPKAAGATYEQFASQGWTDALLIQHGYMLP